MSVTSIDIRRVTGIVIPMSNAFVSWSSRYQSYVLIDGSGRQLFSDGRPLVYATREDAYAAARIAR